MAETDFGQWKCEGIFILLTFSVCSISKVRVLVIWHRMTLIQCLEVAMNSYNRVTYINTNILQHCHWQVWNPWEMSLFFKDNHIFLSNSNNLKLISSLCHSLYSPIHLLYFFLYLFVIIMFSISIFLSTHFFISIEHLYQPLHLLLSLYFSFYTWCHASAELCSCHAPFDFNSRNSVSFTIARALITHTCHLST